MTVGLKLFEVSFYCFEMMIGEPMDRTVREPLRLCYVGYIPTDSDSRELTRHCGL